MALSVAPNPQDINKLASIYYEYFTTQHGLHQLETMTEFLMTILSHPNKDTVHEILWGDAMKNVEEIVRLGKSVSKEEQLYIHQLLNVYKNVIQKMSKSDPSIHKFLKTYFGSKIENKQYGGSLLGIAAKLALVLTLFDTGLKTTGIFHPTADGSSGVFNELGQQGIGGLTERALDSLSASFLGSEDAAARTNYAPSDAFHAASLVTSVVQRTNADIVYDERYQMLSELKGENQVISTTETIDGLSYFSLPQITDAQQTLLSQEKTVQTLLNAPPTSWGLITKEFVNAASAIANKPEYNVFFPNSASVKPSNAKLNSHQKYNLYNEIKNEVTRTHIAETLEGLYKITNATTANDPGSLYPLLTSTNSSMIANKTTFTSAFEKGMSLIQDTNSRMDPIERGFLSRYTVNLIAKPEKIPQRYDITTFQAQIESVLSEYQLTPQEHDIVYFSLMTQAANVVTTNINLELNGIAQQSVIKKIKEEEEIFGKQLNHVETYVRQKYHEKSYTQQTQIISTIKVGLTNLHNARLIVDNAKLDGLIDMMVPQILDGTLKYEARKTVFTPLSRSQKSTHAKLTEAFTALQFSLLGNSLVAGVGVLFLSIKDIISGILSIKIDWTNRKNASANVPKLENKKPNTTAPKPANKKANVPKLENGPKPTNTKTNAPKPTTNAAPQPVPKTPAIRCSKAKPCPEGKVCVKTYCKPSPPAGGAKKTRKRMMKKRTTRRHK